MAEEPIGVPLTIVFEGSEPEDHDLNFYDGAASLFGFAKTLQLTTHYLKNGKVAFQAPSAKGVRLVMFPSKPGSYIQPIEIILNDRVIALPNSIARQGAATRRVNRAEVIDFTNFMIQRTVGRLSAAPQTTLVQEYSDTVAPDLDALSEAIDGPLKEAHRAIATRTIREISLRRRSENFLILNTASYEYLEFTKISPSVSTKYGSVAAYNVNSRRGRFYEQELGRTVPFTPPLRIMILIRHHFPGLWINGPVGCPA